MKKTMLLAGMVALTLTACTKDEEVASLQTSEDNQIRFAVVSDKATSRNTPVPHGYVLTTANLPEFKAYGIASDDAVDAVPELDWTKFSRDENNIFTFQGNQIPRWRSGKPMDFFAFYSGDQDSGPMWTQAVLNKLTMVQDSKGNYVKTWSHHYELAPYSRSVDINEYKHDGWDDLIYAVARNVQPTNDLIRLNFRHALAQICFKAVNKQAEDLKIEVAGFKLDRVYTSATMNWAKGDTNVDFVTDLNDIFQEEGDGKGNRNNPDDFCYWDIDYSQPATGSYLNYHGFAGVAPGVVGNTNPLTIELTDEVQDLTGYQYTYDWAPQGASMKPWFVIPQKFTQWNGTGSDKIGTRLMVLVKITPIDQPEKYPNYLQTINDKEIHSKYKVPTDGAGHPIYVWAAVAPTSRTTWEENGKTYYEWQQNRKYVYTLIFDGFDSGLNPDPDKPNYPEDPDDDDKEPIINVIGEKYPFRFGITVDEYDNGYSDVQMPGAPQGTTSILG